jgi:MinD superfamily P-loop ATPase
MPEIDMEKCNLCGLCVEVCKCNAIIIVDNIVRFIETDACGWCTVCEAVCLTGAMSCPFEIILDEE